MRLIDADKLLKELNPKYKKTVKLIANGETHLDSLAEGYTECHFLIKEAPKVDPVHAAGGCYCRECKYWDKRVEEGTGYCGEDGITTENDFCSLGLVVKR